MKTMTISENLAQLTSRPIAHRGLHNRKNGIIENSSSAVQAAIDHSFGIEVDVRQTASDTPVIFHDKNLERLTNGLGLVREFNNKQLKKLHFKHGSDVIQTLPEFLEQINGVIPIVLEIKSEWQPERTLEKQICQALKQYKGAYAVMSFDPKSIQAIKGCNASIPCGLISEKFSNAEYWSELSVLQRLRLRFLVSILSQKVDFIAYDINALPAIAPFLAQKLYHLPVLTWTVRTNTHQKRAAKWADAMIFEGFIPQ